MARRRPVLFFPRALPFNYRADVLERLNERLEGRLVVCAGRPPDDLSIHALLDRKSRSYRQIELPTLWGENGRIYGQFLFKALWKVGRPSVMMAEESPRSVTLPVTLLCARWLKAGSVLWGHFSSNDRAFRPREHWQDRYRLWTARQADACVCYTDEMADLLKPHLPDERLFVARNTLDTDALFALYDDLAAEGRPAVRRRLDLPLAAPVLTFIGRLIPKKGTDLLLDVFKKLREHQPIILQVIGDGPAQAHMEQRVAHEKIDDVRLLGAMREWDQSAPYLYASDVMLQPGYLGLSVNHAFSFGVPVVSQAPPSPEVRFHSPEGYFVEHGENGMLAEHGNTEALVGAVRHVLSDQERFSQNALRYARQHLTIDRMVDGLEAAIRHAENQRS